MTEIERSVYEQMIIDAFYPYDMGNVVIMDKPKKRFVIQYDAGFGQGCEVVEAASIEEATQAAYNKAVEVWESNMFRKAREFDPVTDGHLVK